MYLKDEDEIPEDKWSLCHDPVIVPESQEKSSEGR